MPWGSGTERERGKMKILYIDAFSGISGDMLLGAMVDLGLPLGELEAQLKQGLTLPDYRLKAWKTQRGTIRGTKFDIEMNTSPSAPLNVPQISRILEESSLKPSVKEKSVRIFRRLAEAEAKVHGVEPQAVHFHELGGIDTIIDIVGAVLGFELLDCQRIVCSPLNLGSGSVSTSHGILPVPAPATLELLRDIPVYGSSTNRELTTPTGAAIISGLVQEFGPLPPMQVMRFGYGAGSQELPDRANMLRLIQGEVLDRSWEEDELTLIEANIDDMNPEFYQVTLDALFQQGALDAYLTPIIMKKGRPATKISILADPHRRDKLLEVLFKNTTTIGARFYQVQRRKLWREVKLIPTDYGPVRVKLCYLEGQLHRIMPELEDCREMADRHRLSLLEVYEGVKAAAQRLLSGPAPEGLE